MHRELIDNSGGDTVFTGRESDNIFYDANGDNHDICVVVVVVVVVIIIMITIFIIILITVIVVLHVLL